MNKIFIFLLSLILIGCVKESIKSTTAWEKINYTEVDGIVEITTGWGKSHLCTGSLIDHNMVLTAAHCVLFPEQDLNIVYGCNDINDSHCKRVPVKKIHKHPKYNKDFHGAHDIAVIITEEPIPLSLAKIYNSSNIPKYLSIMGVGFGQRNHRSGVLYAGRGRLIRNYGLEMVVLMTDRLDPNPGDSGGPALIYDNGKFKIVGILSRVRWNDSDKEKKFRHSGQAIYTKAYPYIEWLTQIKSLHGSAE